METNQGKPVEIEMHTLDLRYAHTRVANPRSRDGMTRSIERYGQLSPVEVIAESTCLVLIDGYLRVGSLGILGRDTVIADVSETDECKALLRLLSTTRQRQWEAVEQAWIIREIKERFDAPLREIAKGIGHDVSWVSRRLALIDELPDPFLKSVLGGHVSAWAACRILVPLARANKSHAEKLTKHLADNPLSTRDLSSFFEHYQCSSKGTRERMIEDPSLFIKVHRQTQKRRSLHALEQGPEGAWIEDLNIVKNVLRRVLKHLPTVIYDGQDKSDRRRHDGHPGPLTAFEEHLPLIKETYLLCRGNVVRVAEMLADRGISIGYSTLTRLAREHGLRQPRKHRAGAYTFEPGVEMQHDTSPHRLVLGERTITAQCAGLVLAYSRRLFIRYYPRFTRFEAKVFLTDAFAYMDGVCERVVIDNTSVIVAHGSGPDAEIAPEMAAFGRIFGVRFIPHRIGHADRKARIERPFDYVERNFLAGRTFTGWKDLNEQALAWCNEKANKKPKRRLGMSPDEAYVMEKPHLRPLPPHIPPIYQTFHRVVDVEAYVHPDTNRYSVPERLIGKKVLVQKHADRVIVIFNHAQVASHARVIDKRDTRVTDPGHHRPLLKHRVHSGPCAEEKVLIGESETLDRYVNELKKRSVGRGMVRLRKLLQLKRSHPPAAFLWAVTRALRYGLYDLDRLEKMILDHIATDFFRLSTEDD